jgi:hypothetical protein
LRVETRREVEHLRVGPRIVAEQSDQILYGIEGYRAPGCRTRRAPVDAAQDKTGRQILTSSSFAPDEAGRVWHDPGTLAARLMARFGHAR